MDVDRQKAKTLGVDLDVLGETLKSCFGSTYVNDFNLNNRACQVVVTADAPFRKELNDVLNLPIVCADGRKVTLSSFATLVEAPTPKFVTRFNLAKSTLVAGLLSPGVTTPTIPAMEKIVRDDLPPGYGLEWTGLAYEQANASSPILTIFLLSSLFGFLVLAALYESWTAPLIVATAVPLGIAGAILSVWAFWLDVNIYTQIGLILMIGLSAKNAILATEFARTKRLEDGLPLREAAFEAGRQRLRPIMTTSFAFILGVVPLLFATGSGAQSRLAIGAAVFGGMLEETMLGILVLPAMFIVVSGIVIFLQTRLTKLTNFAKSASRRRKPNGETLN